MKRISFLVLFFFLAAGFVYAQSPKCLVRLSNLSDKEWKGFSTGDYDLAKTGPGFVEIVTTQDELKAFKKSGIKTAVLIPDLDAYIKGIMDSQTPEAKYYTYETMTAQLQKWAEEYPEIYRIESIGKSWEDREIWAVKISDNPELDEPEAACLFNGLHHAREWTTVEVPMAAMKELLEKYGTDERLTRLVNERETWFVPLVNPDGLTYSQTQYKYWRKNRRPMEKYCGVDLNRNYGYEWGLTGASNNGNSDTYHGPEAFSEPETQALKMLAEREKFQSSICFHSYSELILYPFGYGYNAPTTDKPIFEELGKKMAAFNKYKVENCTDLYPAMGVSVDWFYGELKMLAYTIELGRTFIPPVSEIAKQVEKNVPAIFCMMEETPAYALTTPSGNDTELPSHLDLVDSLNCLKVANGLLPKFSGNAREKVLEKMQQFGQRLVELVSADLKEGKTETWERVKSDSTAKNILPMIKTRMLFDLYHGEKIPDRVISEIKK